MSKVRFDESLPKVHSAVVELLGRDALEQGVALRDGTGLLRFFSKVCPPENKRARIRKEFSSRLAAYARPDGALVFADESGASGVLDSAEKTPVQVGPDFVWVVDRRIVGSGWLHNPDSRLATPPRIVFASLKGGVGRTTALSVSAADLASRGKNVLVVDLDLEAPGLGDTLLPEDRLPDFGVVDYLVEDGIGGIDVSEIDSFASISPLTSDSGGTVTVAPAFGKKCIENPENTLPKLARAMLDDVSDGDIKDVGTQLSEMIDKLTRRNHYDAVLIDARAGLSELTAPAVLGLGAHVLMFGTAQRQTITGYEAMFSALKQLAARDIWIGRNADWRYSLKPVYAKASLDPAVSDVHKGALFELFSENLYDAESDEGLSFSEKDSAAPHFPLTIPFDPRFVDFDPSKNVNQLARPFYEQTFRPFLDGIDEILHTDNRGDQ